MTSRWTPAAAARAAEPAKVDVWTGRLAGGACPLVVMGYTVGSLGRSGSRGVTVLSRSDAILDQLDPLPFRTGDRPVTEVLRPVYRALGLTRCGQEPASTATKPCRCWPPPTPSLHDALRQAAADG